MDSIGKNYEIPYQQTSLEVKKGSSKESAPAREEKDTLSLSKALPGSLEYSATIVPKNGASQSSSQSNDQQNQEGNGKKKSDPHDVNIKYVCSKGDVEYHTAADSEAGVRAHEQNHIKEYNQIAARHGLIVVSPEIEINYSFVPDLEMYVSTGGRASCSFAADIDGANIAVNVTKDGEISDPAIARLLNARNKS